MAMTATGVYLAQHLTLFPPPLQVRKKPRTLALRRLGQRKRTHRQASTGLHGPLDDIIDKITGDIWTSPLHESCELHLNEWPSYLESTSLQSWVVSPLPVSRTPSTQPLTVRKARNSRSTASESIISSKNMASSRNSSEGRVADNELDVNDRSTSVSPISRVSPASDGPTQIAVATSSGPHQSAASQQLSSILEKADSSAQTSESQPFRKRFQSFTSGFGKLRLKTSTNEVTKKGVSSHANSSDDRSPDISSPSDISPTSSRNVEELKPSGLSKEAFSAWLDQNARDASIIKSVHSELADRFPSPLEFRDEPGAAGGSKSTSRLSASMLTASVKILPEVKLLGSEEEQTFWITVQVQGALHNGILLSDPCMDVVFVVDNAYYVTKDCLNRAVDLIAGTLHDLKENDRFSLYTTHCTHETVTGIVPEIWYPLGLVDQISSDCFREMLEGIRSLGTQAWKPARPNPPMKDALAAIAKSLEHRKLKKDRTHLVLLTAVAHDLHDLSISHPSLHIHQVNPAILPFHCDQDLGGTVCTAKCCDTITNSNFACHRSIHDRIRQILGHARSQEPSGAIYDVHVDLRRRPGCEIVKYEGSRTFPHLCLGQVHSFSAQLRVKRNETEEMDMDSEDPIRDSILAANNLRQDLLNATKMGATNVHLLSVQIMHKNTLLPSPDWTFIEMPLVVIKDLGRLSEPKDHALEVYKHRVFYTMSRLDLDSAIDAVKNLDNMAKPEIKEQAKNIQARIAKETEAHVAIVEYEKASRQNLPSCRVPMIVPPPHEFLVEKWEACKMKRGVLPRQLSPLA